MVNDERSDAEMEMHHVGVDELGNRHNQGSVSSRGASIFELGNCFAWLTLLGDFNV